MSKVKRRSPRFAIHRLTHLAYGVESYLDAEGVNISKTGVLCRTPEAIGVGDKVSLTVEMPTGTTRSFTCEGNVVRCERQQDNYFEVGVTFSTVEDAGRAVLQTL